MDWLDFTASVVSSVAWPFTVLVAVWLLRKPITAALTAGAVKRWKVGPGGVEIENWDRVASDLRPEIAEFIDEAPKDLISSASALASAWQVGLSVELADLARVSPATAVLVSFRRIEAELRELVQGSLDENMTVQKLPMAGLVNFALEKSLITPETATAIDALSVMRNLAAHNAADSQLDAGRALEFTAMADAILFAIRNSRPAPPTD